MSKPEPTLLATRNAHPRDEFIKFYEGPHIYLIRGAGGYTSVIMLKNTEQTEDRHEQPVKTGVRKFDWSYKSRHWESVYY